MMKSMGQLAVIALSILLIGTQVSASGQTGPKDIRLVQGMVDSSRKYFEEVWLGTLLVYTPSRIAISRFSTSPNVIAFVDSYNTGCGKALTNNAMFCDSDNTIYLDAAFLAQEKKDAAAALHTSGDYAAIVIVAHEFGHAIAKVLNLTFDSEYAGEEFADCMSGAIFSQAKADGKLEAESLDEAQYSVSSVGDDMIFFDPALAALDEQISKGKIDYRSPPPKRCLLEFMCTPPPPTPIKNYWVLEHTFIRRHGLSHGIAERRKGAFLDGYNHGKGACLAPFIK